MCSSERRTQYKEDWLEQCAGCPKNDKIIENEDNVGVGAICHILATNAFGGDGIMYHIEDRPLCCPSVLEKAKP